MELLKEILKIIDIITVAYLIYYIITGLCELKSKNKMKEETKKHKFAVIVPARNEEKVIGNLLKSLNNQEYPKDCYDIFVVVNNCTDRTKEIALENEAQVIECKTSIKSKGEALKIAFRKLKNDDYEAYIIFDADNIVHPKFINKMNNALGEGYELAQGFRDSKNVSDTWISSCYSIHYLIHNIFLNKARMNIDKSSFINGTGFMISKKFLDRKGYKVHTLTEDIELTTRCALDNEMIAFVEDAITYDEQPTTFKESWKQRKRWSIGTVQCFKIYSRKLIKKFFRKNNFTSIDAFIFLISPLLQFLGALSYLLHFLIGVTQLQYMNYSSKIISILIWYLASLILAIVAIKIRKKHILPYIKGILTLPIFVLSWIPINILAIFSRKKQNIWEKIEHTRDVTIDKILEVTLK